MGPLNVTEVGIWNYENRKAREAYYVHMDYMNAVARKMQPKPKKVFTEPKRKMCEWPGCEVKTKSKYGFCVTHTSSKSRRHRCDAPGCTVMTASATGRCRDCR